MSLWVKSQAGNEQAFKVAYKSGMDIDDLKTAITSASNLPAGAVHFIRSSESDDESNVFDPEEIVPNSEKGTIGGSSKMPYYYSFAQHQAISVTSRLAELRNNAGSSTSSNQGDVPEWLVELSYCEFVKIQTARSSTRKKNYPSPVSSPTAAAINPSSSFFSPKETFPAVTSSSTAAPATAVNPSSPLLSSNDTSQSDPFVTPKKGGRLERESNIMKLHNNQWINEADFIFSRDIYIEFKSILFDRKVKDEHVCAIVEGRSGTGKSLFLTWMIAEIFMDAKTAGSSPTIIYVLRTANAAYLLKPDQMPQRVDIYKSMKCDYFFLDNANVDPSILSCKFFLAVTSMKEELALYRKFQESKKEIRLFMLNFSYEECKQAFLPQGSSVDEEERLQFRFDIIGGNPRLIMKEIVTDAFLEDETLEKAINDTICSFFNHRYNIDHQYVIWARRLILAYTSRTAADTRKLLTTVLFTKLDSIGGRSVKNNYSSIYMGMLATYILKKKETSIFELLRDIVSASGIGYCKEYLATKTLVSSKRLLPVFDDSNGIIILEIPELRKCLIRNLNDIPHLKEGDYGLPTVTNYPIIDGIFITALFICLIQITISKTHRTAPKVVHELFQVVRQLSLSMNGKPICMIWMLEREAIMNFKPDTIFGAHDITSYRMLTEKASETELVSLMRRQSKHTKITEPQEGEESEGEEDNASQRVARKKRKLAKSSKTTLDNQEGEDMQVSEDLSEIDVKERQEAVTITKSGRRSVRPTHLK